MIFANNRVLVLVEQTVIRRGYGYQYFQYNKQRFEFKGNHLTFKLHSLGAILISESVDQYDKRIYSTQSTFFYPFITLFSL